jgi:uncharacterized protein with HEPN domain
MERAWHFYLDDIIGFAGNVLAYTANLSQAEFEQSRLHYDATVRNLELIGEAATHIPLKLREAAPDIPWRLMIATRNRLIHGYLGIDNDTLWSIVQENIPSLVDELGRLKERVDNEPGLGENTPAP